MDIRSGIEEQVQGFTETSSEKLLPDLHPLEQHVFTLVLDLNETLVYSDWKRDRGWRTFKRLGVDAFLEHLAKFYEIVVYSDQLSMYVDPVIERPDQKGCIRYRLARNATRYLDGKHYRVRNEKAEDFLSLLHEWDRLCQRFGVLEKNSHVEHDRNSDQDEEVEDLPNDPEIFEVEGIIGVCYGETENLEKVGLKFKVWIEGDLRNSALTSQMDVRLRVQIHATLEAHVQAIVDAQVQATLDAQREEIRRQEREIVQQEMQA